MSLLLVFSPFLSAQDETLCFEVNDIQQYIDRGDAVFILSIDGGGVRGIIPLYVIDYLEKKTKHASADVFQFIAGTSSGAVIACGLTLPDDHNHSRFSAEFLLQHYNQDGGEIFYSPWWHTILTLNGYLGTRFSPIKRNKFIQKLTHKITLSQLRSNVLIATISLLYRRPLFFKNWEAKEDRSNDYYLEPLLEGATSPLTIFPPQDICNVIDENHDVIMDGGYFLNNPSLQALLDAQALYPNKKIILVSLGTGRHLPHLSYEEVEDYDKKWGIVQGARTAFEFTLGINSENTNSQLLEICRLRSGPLIAYYRFDLHIAPAHQSGFDGSKENIEALNVYGKNLVENSRETLDDIAELLTRAKALYRN